MHHKYCIATGIPHDGRHLNISIIVYPSLTYPYIIIIQEHTAIAAIAPTSLVVPMNAGCIFFWQAVIPDPWSL